jgi:hypothetical protein
MLNLQHQHNNPSHEGGPYTLGPTLMWGVVVWLLWWCCVWIKFLNSIWELSHRIQNHKFSFKPELSLYFFFWDRDVNSKPVSDYWVIIENRFQGLRLLVFNNRPQTWTRVPQLTQLTGFYLATWVKPVIRAEWYIYFFKKKITFLGLFLVLDLLF